MGVQTARTRSSGLEGKENTDNDIAQSKPFLDCPECKVIRVFAGIHLYNHKSLPLLLWPYNCFHTGNQFIPGNSGINEIVVMKCAIKQQIHPLRSLSSLEAKEIMTDILR